MATTLALPQGAALASGETRSGVSTSAATATAGSDVAASAQRKAKYRPREGVTFQRPGSRGIDTSIVKAINYTRKGSKIRIMSWNFDSYRMSGALKAAHNRGVSVRIIVARTLYNAQSGGRPMKITQRALQSGNKRRPPELKSWLRTCSNSCRGKGGSMHSKSYVFSKTGGKQYVVMSSSANLTAAASRVQWNDHVTTVGRKATYDAFIKVFGEATLDKPAPYYQRQDGPFLSFFNPTRGAKDQVMVTLNKVRCTGAVGAGRNGRTTVLIAQDVFNAKRGVRIAKKIRQLHRSGCIVRVVFSQAVGGAGSIIAQVPNNHLVKDKDGDGAYDVYLHAKAMAISGNYGGDPGARVVLQGSANWSGLASLSDEQSMIVERDGFERKYGKWIQGLMGIRLRNAKPNPNLPRVADPYINMEG